MLTGPHRLIIMILLLTTFVSRMGIAVVTGFKFVQETLKESNDEKTDNTEKENQLEEKIKLADIIVPTIGEPFFFNPEAIVKNSFPNRFDMTYCHLSILIQPPKIKVI